MLPFVLFALCLSAPSTMAAAIKRRDEPSTLSASSISHFRPYTYYAAAAYCEPDDLLTWSCGANCEHAGNFTPVAAGGDGNAVQHWFVGYDASVDSVIVGHQGTDPFKFLSVLTDLEAIQTPLPVAFTGIPEGALVHKGFLDEHTITAPDVLAAVNTSLAKFSTNSVTIVGHSLGGALALLDGAYLRITLPSVNVRVVSFGMPRVGNAEFATWIDQNLPELWHVNNRIDPVPIVPGRHLGYTHPAGEVHIKEDEQWVACAGQDNTDDGCTIADNNNIITANVLNHFGPYDGALMGFCWFNGGDLSTADAALVQAVAAAAVPKRRA